MTDFTKGENRYQSPLFTERLHDYIAEVSAMCVVDVFIDDLDLSGLGFEGKRKASTAWLEWSGPLYSAPLNMVPGHEL